MVAAFLSSFFVNFHSQIQSMKKILIASIVGALILFMWQALSWMVLPFHTKSMQLSDNDAEIIAVLQKNMKADGLYMVPGVPQNLSEEEKQKLVNNFNGKPWAMIDYHSSFNNTNMAPQMIRGYLIAFVAVWLVCWWLKGINGFSNIVLRTASVGFLLWLFVWYNQHNWFQTSWAVLTAELIDLMVAWLLCGLWLGWWLGKKAHK